jgi:hypothetical protein
LRRRGGVLERGGGTEGWREAEGWRDGGLEGWIASRPGPIDTGWLQG